MDVPLPAAPRFLIVRLSAIGDCVHGLPVANALRANFPRAEIGWVIEGRSADLLRGHPAIDQVINVPRGWYKSWRRIRELRAAVRAFAPTVTLDLQGLTKSAAVAWLSGAKTRIGFARNEGREISRWLNNVRVAAASTHVVAKNLELLRPLGIAAPQADFALPRDPAAIAALTPFLAAHQLNWRFAILNPGAGWASKRWPPARFAEVANALGQRFGLTSLITWAPGEERHWAEQIAAASGGHALPAPPTSLRELTELARAAAVFISGDTGPLHLAAAVGTPCVALFGASDGARNGPYGPQHIVLQPVKLTGGSRARRTADNSALCAISVAHVVDACAKLLARHKLAA